LLTGADPAAAIVVDLLQAEPVFRGLFTASKRDRRVSLAFGRRCAWSTASTSLQAGGVVGADARSSLFAAVAGALAVLIAEY